MDANFVVIGSGKLTVQIAEQLQEQGVCPTVCEKKIAAVSAVEKLCQSKEIPYYGLSSSDLTQYLQHALKEGPLRAISAINTYIFPEEVTLDENFYGINYHNALLPNHKGMNAEAWAIYEGDAETGITWHRIRPAIDCGEILIRKSMKIDKAMTSLKLLKEQAALAFQAFQEIVRDFIAGESHGVAPQAGASGAMHKIKDVPNDGYLHLAWDAERISAFLRAMDYGKLYTLNRPKLVLDGSEYTWHRYQISEKAPAEKDCLITDGEDLVIAKRGSRTRIRLKKYEKMEVLTS